METQVPENLDDLSIEQLAELEEALTNEFDAAYEGDEPAPLDTLTQIANALDSVRSAKASREAAAAEEQAERESIASRVRTPAEEPVAEEAPAEEPVAEEAPAEEPVMVTAAATPTRPTASAAAIARQTATPEPPPSADGGVVITAAADLAGHSTGARMGRTDIATGFHSRARSLPDHSGRKPVATIDTGIAPEFTISESTGDHSAVLDAVVASVLSPGADAEALIASGGWCTPSVNLFDQFSIESRDGLLDLPTVGVQQGGTNVPSWFGIADAQGALWSWTEDIDANVSLTISDLDVVSNTATATTSEAHNLYVGATVKIFNASVPALNETVTVASVPSGTTFTYSTDAADAANATAEGQIRKGVLDVPCPTWTDVRLEAEGMSLKHGNLMDRAYPQMTARFVDLTMTAHMHKLSNAKLAKIIATATSVTVPRVGDALGDLMYALDLQVADYRSQYLMSEDVVLEAAFPQWVVEAARASLGLRAGIDGTNTAKAAIRSLVAQRNVRAQFLAGYDALYRGATARTAFPATSKFLLWASGAYLAGDGGAIDLGVQRDSELNATNDFTLAWSEQFYSVIQRGPAAREVTFSTVANGKTGGPSA